jgi:hypothetical protein
MHVFGWHAVTQICAAVSTAYHRRCSSSSAKILSPARCISSEAAAANKRHSAYSFRTARIAYPWHPLFGQTLQVSSHRRGKDLQCIYTDERPDLSRELPTWMFDASYCAGMALGEPQISIAGLLKFAAALEALATQTHGARSPPSIRKEKDRAEKSISQPSSACSLSRTSSRRMPPAAQHEGAHRSLGRSSPRGHRCPAPDDEGRR